MAANLSSLASPAFKADPALHGRMDGAVRAPRAEKMMQRQLTTPATRPRLAAQSLNSGGRRTSKITKVPDALGGSPVWDNEAGCVWWIDSVAGRVRRLFWSDNRPEKEQCFYLGEHIGAIVLAGRERLVAALENSFVLFDPQNKNTITIAEVQDIDPKCRLNDSKTDREGGLLCAGMGRMGDPLGCLYRINTTGVIESLLKGLKIGNAVCFSPDGETLYFSDTPEGHIYACDYHPADGKGLQPRIHIDATILGAGPEGATIDEKGYLWASLTDVGKIARFDPTGRLVELYEAPTDLPSGLAFGGPDMATLFVTTIRDSGTGRAVSSHSDGGHMFAVEGLGVRGITEARFAGVL